MNLKETLEKSILILKEANIEAPAIDAGVILCHVLVQDKTFLYTHPEYILNEETANQCFRLIKMRAEGMPVQYITGHQEFMSIDFVVNKEVLIPRPDTETLMGTVMQKSNSFAHENIEILEIGTGSGCIAISLARFIENCSITAVDISEKALEVAKLNAMNAGVEEKITFLKSNLFEVFGAQEKKEVKFDIIVSNPPYATSDEMKLLQREVKDYEPVLAIFGGQDGLDFYREIIAGAVNFLKPSGMLAFEVGYKQAADVANLMKEKYFDIEVYKDLSDIDRVVSGHLR